MIRSASDEPVISVSNLSKQYGSLFKKGVHALKGVTFDVRPGEVFALLGPNGAGKTTLVKILLGIIRASGGKANMLGYSAGDRRSRRRAGYLPEHLRVPRHHTARTALDFYGKLSGMNTAAIRSKRDGLIEQVGLSGRDRESVKRFSKGMLQRLGLAQALLHEPDLLILDEPTDGLDPVGRKNVRAIMGELRDQGRTVFLNSHLLQEVELVCDRVAILNHGTLKFVGTIDELTPKEGSGEVQFSLLGDVEKIKSIFPDWMPPVDQPETHPFQIEIAAESRSASDQLIDQLRGAEISILSMSWKGQTLEEAFLSLVSPETPS